MGPERILCDIATLLRAAGAISRHLIVITEFIPCIVGTIAAVADALQGIVDTFVTVGQFILQIMELAVHAVPVIAIAVAVVFQIVQAGTAPLTQSIG